MKRQGCLWAKTGARAMICVIDSLRNNELERWLNQYEALPEETIIREEQWKKMKRAVQRAPLYRVHEEVFKGLIG